MARKKTENSYLSLKLAVRREAVAGLDQVRVLDAFGGRNTLWSQIPTDRYYGVEKQKGKGQNLPADNRRALESLNLADFNVIDLDAYGSRTRSWPRSSVRAACSRARASSSPPSPGR